MEGVPLKMPDDAAQEVIEDVKVTAPDYLNMLRETQYEFSLENWVLTGLQNGFINHQRPQVSSSTSGLQPSCPPYWMMFSSPQQSRLASRHSSDFWEPNPRQRSFSLNPAVLRTKFAISDSEDEAETPVEKENTSSPSTNTPNEDQPAALSQHSYRKAQKAFVPDLLHPPTCISSLPHQRRKNLRQCSFSVLETSKQDLTNEESPHTSTKKALNFRSESVDQPFSQKPTHTKSISPNSCTNPSAASRPLALSTAGCDSSVELLSALSPEERELLGAITARGYPLRTAIIALQKTGQQAPEKILNYVVACDHLCQLGYDMIQVEEALEMFQNCETKAEEFLHLLSQFNEMGFQQNAIKEVLLVHENHRERALEELMMRVA